MAPDNGKLWAITCYFNPVRYRRRLENYYLFRRRLRVPLITVELSFERDFQLPPGSADILVQLRGHDVLWQKERLLNVALQALPDDCQHVAWLDCDVLFERDDWFHDAARLLDEVALIQPFREVYELPESGSSGGSSSSPSGFSFAHKLAEGAASPELLRGNMRLAGCNSGLAWAARREVLESDGFYDACVMGSGNRAMVSAALGRPGDAIDYLQMTDAWSAHYHAWAQSHFRVVQGKIGCLHGGLFHLWHGDLHKRRYLERHRDFRHFDFDPFGDIALDEPGCWRWNTDKREMHQYVRRYFESRREDG